MEIQFQVKELSVVLHRPLDSSVLRVHCQLTECFLNYTLLVEMYNIGIHLLLSTSDLDVAGHSCKGDLNQPLITDFALYRALYWLQADLFSTNCKPMTEPSLAHKLISHCL